MNRQIDIIIILQQTIERAIQAPSGMIYNIYGIRNAIP